MKTDKQDRANPYQTLPEVEALVREFESCTLPLANFKHHAHLAVTLFYLSRMSRRAATARVRAGLRRLIAHYGLKGYNETITLFWLKVVHSFLAESDTRRSFVEHLDSLVRKYGDSQLVFDYYTRELLMSAEAQSYWVEPDLKPLDF